jgi:hypothetical protein
MQGTGPQGQFIAASRPASRSSLQPLTVRSPTSVSVLCNPTMRYSTLVLALAASLPTSLAFSETFPVVAWSSHR